MNKTTKGSLAAGAAAVLLLGGAGSLAFWTDTADIAGTNITSGFMNLTDPDCGEGWLLQGTAYTTQRLVPGDTLTQTCTFVLEAEGDNLLADFDVEQGTGLTGDPRLTPELDLSTRYLVGATEVGTDLAPPTGVAVVDGDTITIDMEIDWAYGVENNTSNVQGPGLTAALADIVFTATQSNATGND